MSLLLRGTEPWPVPWIIKAVTWGQTCYSDPALAGEESPPKQQWTKRILHSVPILGTPFRMTAQYMSIVVPIYRDVAISFGSQRLPPGRDPIIDILSSQVHY